MVFLQIHCQPDKIYVKILTNPPKNGKTLEVAEEGVRDKLEELGKTKPVEITWSCLTYSVYVIRLTPEVRMKKKMIGQNPQENLKGDYLYVGMTGLSTEERIGNHREGHKSCNLVKLFYREPLPERYEREMSYERAVRRERELAEELRREGFWVYQN